MSPVTCLLVSLSLVVTVSCFDPVTQATNAAPVNLKPVVKRLINKVRDVADGAKNGMYLDPLHQKIMFLQAAAAKLIQQLPGEVSECETNSVIKMAAAGTGSHEVLTVMLADDPLSVLSGRLSLALAFLEHVAQQLENELSMSAEVGPQLAAIVFGTNTTAVIIETADKTVKSMAPVSHDSNNRVRRQLKTSVNLGRGWKVGLGGVSWGSRGGRASFNVRPTFTGLRPSGVRAGFKIRF